MPKTDETLALMTMIDATFLDCPWYGSRQMARHLRRAGHEVGRRRARRLMAKMGLTLVEDGLKAIREVSPCMMNHEMQSLEKRNNFANNCYREDMYWMDGVVFKYDILRSYYEMLSDAQDFFMKWLCNDALPLWFDKGADRDLGGFYERLNSDGSPHHIDRRTRVAARQVYSYATARMMGYAGPADEAIAHGLAWLSGPAMNVTTGFAYPVLSARGEAVHSDFDLYDHAFILLGYAAAYAVNRDDNIRQAAAAMRDRIIHRYAHPGGGFWDAGVMAVPLKANPHMHMLEACLAWVEVQGDATWTKVASGIVELCLGKFIDSKSGALKEFFDSDWRPVDSEAGRIVDPGHQFEWAWLLLRWAKHSADERYRAAAERLLEIGESYGTDPVRNVTVNALWDDFSIKDADARLWPQTERIKAYCAFLTISTHERRRCEIVYKLVRACDGLKRYLVGVPPGFYRDRMLVDGSFVEESAPASTLYHIVCAIRELCLVERNKGVEFRVSRSVA